MASEIRVLIADDHPQFLRALRAMLENAGDLHIVADCASGLEAIRKAAETQPDVMLLDIQMPGMDGISVCSAIPCAGIPVVLLTMYRDAELLVRAREAGARGYVLKENAAEEVVAAVRAVAAGGIYTGRMCPEFGDIPRGPAKDEKESLR
jgi:DNA-binding NarL/FixJ family response regulator